MGVDIAASKPGAKKPAVATPRKKAPAAPPPCPEVDFTALGSVQGLASALAASAADLCKATEDGLFCEPLNRNLELWVAIKALLGSAPDSVAEPSRANLTQLAGHVAAYTTALARDFAPERVAQLIEINLKIAQGLIEGVLNQVIRDRAYYIWLESGCPQGRDQEHWCQAEQEIKGLMNP